MALMSALESSIKYQQVRTLAWALRTRRSALAEVRREGSVVSFLAAPAGTTPECMAVLRERCERDAETASVRMGADARVTVMEADPDSPHYVWLRGPAVHVFRMLLDSSGMVMDAVAPGWRDQGERGNL
jgi:hypothetical protein